MSEEKNIKRFKHFCDNDNCPNYNLELNDENHYHDTDADVTGSICGILRTYPYAIKKQRTKKISKFVFWERIIKEDITINIHLCDICNSAVQLMRGEFYV